MKEKMIRFFKQETVLCAAFALALVSMLFVRPDIAANLGSMLTPIREAPG